MRLPLSYWHTRHGHEVDFIIDDEVAIEVKTTNKMTDKHFKNLHLLNEENICKRFIIVSHDTINRKNNGFEAMHWQTFLDKLWRGEII